MGGVQRLSVCIWSDRIRKELLHRRVWREQRYHPQDMRGYLQADWSKVRGQNEAVLRPNIYDRNLHRESPRSVPKTRKEAERGSPGPCWQIWGNLRRGCRVLSCQQLPGDLSHLRRQSPYLLATPWETCLRPANTGMCPEWGAWSPHTMWTPETQLGGSHPPFTLRQVVTITFITIGNTSSHIK